MEMKMTSEIKHSHLNPAQVYELNERHGYFQYADAQGDVSREFANDAVAAYLLVNEEAQAVMAEHSLSPRELLERCKELEQHIESLLPYAWQLGCVRSFCLACSGVDGEHTDCCDFEIARAALAKHKDV